MAESIPTVAGTPDAITPAALDEALSRYVRLPTFPLAVSWVARMEDVPAKLKRPKQDLGIEVAVCQTFALARRYGWGLAVGREDLSCPLAAVAFGYEPALPFYDEGNLCVEMYTKDAAAGARSEAAIPKFAVGHHAARVDCAELVIRTHQAGEPQVVLPCYGDRIFGQTGDDEMGFAWPWSWTATIMAGLEGTQKGGVRYPVPSFLRYTGEYPETYERLKAMWKENA